MSPVNHKRRLLRVLAVSAVAAALLGVYALSYARGGRGLPCPLLLLTGWRCPACGMTRAAIALLELDPGAAFSHNALWPLYAAYLLWMAAANAVAYVRRGSAPLLPSPAWVHGAMLALVLAYGLARNLL